MISQNEITLRCYANGKPLPTVNWYKDGVAVQGDSPLSAPGVILLDIVIPNPNCTHIGKYMCKAENEHGINETAEKFVTREGSHEMYVATFIL